MPKQTIPERTFIVEKYFETKSVVAVLRRFQIAFPGRNLHRAFGVMSTNTGCICIEWKNHPIKPAAHESYLLSQKLLVPVSSADSSPIKHV
jgi:hypothetical protein